ncbi:MAG: hypothetical protein IPK17_13665 [Chloroflexi bacterium]|uniref:hypothetical protein n=1 Tax=Candidatus Flexifilum breve TaxID=3140694 RepID=UPI0031355F3E|nr:hypothetical protein [Chloroflexota bacterium]
MANSCISASARLHAYLVNNPREAHYVLVEAPERFTDRPNYLKTLNSAMGHDLFPPKDKLGGRDRIKPPSDPAGCTTSRIRSRVPSTCSAGVPTMWSRCPPISKP